jgi:hypothetical protein
VGCIAVGLGALGVFDDVLDGPRVEAEFVGQLTEQAVIGVAQIHPHQGAGLMKMFRQVHEWEILDLQHPVQPQPRPDGRSIRTGAVGGHVDATGYR